MEAELMSQPEVWRQALEMEEERHVLPEAGQRVAVIGNGTSWFMAKAYAALREKAGHGVTDAFTPTEFPADREYDAYVVICRSGTTTEIIEFLEKHQSHKTVVITAVPDSPVTQVATHSVLLPFADEQSVVQTRYATTALMFLRASLEQKDTLLAVADQAEKLLNEDPDPDLIDAEQYSFLGVGWTGGLAEEAALKMRESCQWWTESYFAMEYRHGPIAVAQPGRVTWMFGKAPEGLAQQVAHTGARFEDRDVDPLADLVRVHKVALLKSRALGLDADAPRHLTRSVVLK